MVISLVFVADQPFRTYLNHSTMQKTRPGMELDMILRWFSSTKPPRITKLQMEQGWLYYSYDTLAVLHMLYCYTVSYPQPPPTIWWYILDRK